MDTRALINRAKIGAGDALMSDAAIARELGISRSAFLNMQRAGLNDGIAIRLARLAGVDPAAVLAAARAQRERDPEVKSVLERIAQKVAGTAAAVFLATGMHVGNSHALGGGEGR